MKPIQAALTGAIAAVKTADKFEQLQYIIPQRLEDGKLINFKGTCIGTFEAEDQIFTPEDVKRPTRMTAAFIKSITDPVAALILDVNEVPVEESMAKEPKKSKKSKKEPVETEDEDSVLTIGDIKALVDTGKKKKIKEAKKAFKDQFSKDHPDYKELKKLFKNA